MVLSPEDTCLVMTIIPVLMLACYFGLLSKRPEGNARLSAAVQKELSYNDKVRQPEAAPLASLSLGGGAGPYCPRSSAVVYGTPLPGLLQVRADVYRR